MGGALHLPGGRQLGAFERFLDDTAFLFERLLGGEGRVTDRLLTARPGAGMIPSAALERGERAFVAVLRRRYPDALFVLRDGAVGPEDADVAGEVAAGAAADVDPVDERG